MCFCLTCVFLPFFILASLAFILPRSSSVKPIKKKGILVRLSRQSCVHCFSRLLQCFAWCIILSISSGSFAAGLLCDCFSCPRSKNVQRIFFLHHSVSSALPCTATRLQPLRCSRLQAHVRTKSTFAALLRTGTCNIAWLEKQIVRRVLRVLKRPLMTET